MSQPLSRPLRLSTDEGRVPTFSSAHAPALKVRPGEVFTVQTADRFAPLFQGQSIDPQMVGAMAGPVYVRDAQAGKVLEIEILDIRSVTGHAYILTSPGYGTLGGRVETRTKRVEVIDDQVRWDDGKRFEVRPMIGKIGLAPAGPEQPSKSSGNFGGAISSQQVGPGSSLYLPIACDGALLTLEDVHARMGDGEATASAVEMAAEVDLRCYVHPPTERPLPLVVTSSEVVTHGQGDTLDEATDQAVGAMLQLITGETGVDLTEAAMLVGAVVDLRISFVGDRPRKVRAAIARTLVGI